MTHTETLEPKRSGKTVPVRVNLLDGSVQDFQLSPRASGQVFYNTVMKKLQLLESDYFDLEYTNKEGFSCWLDHEKALVKQTSDNDSLNFSFGVKFYSPHPNLLEDEYTRYLFALQIKKDLLNGTLYCNSNTSALLAAFIVQAEIGDFLEDEYVDYSYLSGLQLVKNRTQEFLIHVMEYHRTLLGQSPAEADFNLLDTARKVELYGIRMHHAKDHEGLPLNLAVAHMGILVFQQTTKINTFSWAKIRKLSFKRKKFLIKLHPEGYGYYKDTVEFYFETRNACKNFWKQCIEHHAFFRCQTAEHADRRKSRVVSKGSSYRYTGRTEKQLVDYVRENYVKRPHFERSASTGRVSSARSPAVASRHSRLATSAAGGVSRPPGGGVSSSTGLGLSLFSGTASSASYTMNSSSPRSHSSSSSDSHIVGSSHEQVSRGGQKDVHRSVSESPRARRGMERALSLPEDRGDESPPPREVNLEKPGDGFLPQNRVLSMENADSRKRESVDYVTDQYRSIDGPLMGDGKIGGSLSPTSLGAGDSIRGPSLDNDSRRNSATQLTHNMVAPLAEINVSLSSQSNTPCVTSLSEIDKEASFTYPKDQSAQATSHISPPPYSDMDLPPPYPDTNRANTVLPGTDREQSTTIIHDYSPPRQTHMRLHEVTGGYPYEHRTPESQAASTTGLSLMGGGAMTTLSSVSGGRSQSDVDDAVSGGALSEGTRAESEPEPTGGQGVMKERRRKRTFPSDRAYYLAKELLMTERTYKKDLELICVHLHKAVSSVMPDTLSRRMFGALDPLYDHQVQLVRHLEARLGAWEGRYSGTASKGNPDEVQRVGDIFLANLKMLTLYRKYFEVEESLLMELEGALQCNSDLESAWRGFEARKECYLPLYCFLLHPMHRILHCRLVLDRLTRHYPDENPDSQDCREAHAQLLDVIQTYKESYSRMENRVKLLELQRDLIGFTSMPGQVAENGLGWGSIAQPGREFIREGWLQKLSKRGYQQRMFFLFSDQLVYGSRVAVPHMQFKVHGQFPLRDLLVDSSEAAHSFTLTLGTRCILVAAATDWLRDRWLDDLERAVVTAKALSPRIPRGPVLRDGEEEGEHGPESVCSSATGRESRAGCSSRVDDQAYLLRPIDRQVIQQRTNTTVHVCWHRSVSVSMADILRTNECKLSGYLLRKFKNSNGWQKLWVVFSNFCLFFYKSFQDECPLASLPLLGYTISNPTPEDAILKEHVLKIQFKTHIYFFRAESQHVYDRWYEVLTCSTKGALRTRVISGRLRTN